MQTVHFRLGQTACNFAIPYITIPCSKPISTQSKSEPLVRTSVMHRHSASQISPVHAVLFPGQRSCAERQPPRALLLHPLKYATDPSLILSTGPYMLQYYCYPLASPRGLPRHHPVSLATPSDGDGALNGCAAVGALVGARLHRVGAVLAEHQVGAREEQDSAPRLQAHLRSTGWALRCAGCRIQLGSHKPGLGTGLAPSPVAEMAEAEMPGARLNSRA